MPARIVGPFSDEDEAQAEAVKLNEARGGPGFHVERRGALGDTFVDGPYAYVPQEDSPGRWYAALRLLAELR